jgi:hypothetical protein
LNAPHGVNINAGVFEGTGTINGNVVNGATVHPGDSPGVLTINGNYTQSSAGLLDFTLTSSTNYSQLHVGNAVSLDGTINVAAPASTLTTGEKFTLITFGNLTGDFAAFDYNGKSCTSGGTDQWACTSSTAVVDFKGIITNKDYEVQVASVSSVPLPAALPMFGAAVFGLGAAGRRRAKKS